MNEKILYALNAICKNSTPGKKVVQKLIYLMERKGVEMNLPFSIHFYGPYSSDLDLTLHSFENNRVVEIDTSKKTHFIKFISKETDFPISEKEAGLINNVIQVFGQKSPLELEVITTTDFVVNNWLSDKQITKEEVVRQVRRIKGEKFTEQQILSTIELLNSESLINVAI